MATKGSEPFSRSKVREREKVGQSGAGRDCTIRPGEEIPWAAHGEITFLPGVNMKSGFCLSKDKRPAGSH